MKLFVSALLLVLTVTCHANDDDSRARLLVAKQIHNRYLVESKDILVEYSIYNVGNSAAHKVVLNDPSFPEDKFDVVSGIVTFQLERLAPNTNVTHVVVVHPKHAGHMNFTAAQIRYLATEDATQEQIGHSSEPGEGMVIPFKDYDRKFSPHFLDWAAFAVMTLPSLGIPFLLWRNSKSKYENFVKPQPTVAKKH